MKRFRRILVPVTLVLVMAALAAGCGDDDTDTATSGSLGGSGGAAGIELEGSGSNGGPAGENTPETLPAEDSGEPSSAPPAGPSTPPQAGGGGNAGDGNVASSPPGEPSPEPAGPRQGVSGRVTDARTGRPIEGAAVAPMPKDGRPMTLEVQVTDADGRYAWTLSAGEYDIQVSANGYRPATKTVNVTAEKVATADFELQPA